MSNSSNSKSAARPTATQACAEHNREILGLVDSVREGLIDCTTARWGDVGDAGHARELLVRAAFALGQITEDEALERHGVIL